MDIVTLLVRDTSIIIVIAIATVKVIVKVKMTKQYGVTYIKSSFLVTANIFSGTVERKL